MKIYLHVEAEYPGKPETMISSDRILCDIEEKGNLPTYADYLITNVKKKIQEIQEIQDPTT